MSLFRAHTGSNQFKSLLITTEGFEPEGRHPLPLGMLVRCEEGVSLTVGGLPEADPEPVAVVG